MSIFPTKILLATDGSKEAELAARTAVGLSDSTNSELHVVVVGPVIPVPFDPTEVEPARMAREAQELLDEQVEKVKAAGGVVAQAHLKTGGAAEEIVNLGEEMEAGLIAMGSRGRGGIRRALMGSISDSVVRHAHCPVLVAREGKREERGSVFPTKILLATDGSEEAELALHTAVDLANGTNSELHVVTVGREYRAPYDIPEYGKLLEDALLRLEQEAQEVLGGQVKKIEEAGGTVAGAHLRTGVLGGRRDQEIVRLGEELDAGLIVMGSRGLGGVRRALLGSVSDGVVRHAHCPVLVVRKEKR